MSDMVRHMHYTANAVSIYCTELIVSGPYMYLYMDSARDYSRWLVGWLDGCIAVFRRMLHAVCVVRLMLLHEWEQEKNHIHSIKHENLQLKEH